MPSNALYIYWITRAAVTAFLLTGLLAGLVYGTVLLHRRLLGKE